MTPLLRSAAILATLCMLVGCFSSGRKPVPYNYMPYVTSDPHSVVVAPMVEFNNNKQSAHYLATITQPLAERGYYVMPVRMTQELAAEQGFGERQLEVRRAWSKNSVANPYAVVDPDDGMKAFAADLAKFFGADSVLFVYIRYWGHRVLLDEGFLANLVDDKKEHSVDLDYFLIDARGEPLWRARKRFDFVRGGGGIFTEIWNASTKPADEEIDTAIARDINRLMIEARTSKNKVKSFFDSSPMLVGPYHPNYANDRSRRRPQ